MIREFFTIHRGQELRLNDRLMLMVLRERGKDNRRSFDSVCRKNAANYTQDDNFFEMGKNQARLEYWR